MVVWLASPLTAADRFLIGKTNDGNDLVDCVLA